MESEKKAEYQKTDDGVAEEFEFRKDEKDLAQVEVATLNLENRAELEKKLVWKLDMRLLPLMMLICMHYRHAVWSSMLTSAIRCLELSRSKQHRDCETRHL